MIGTRIMTARKKAGLSLRGLADAIGKEVSAQAIGKYERGESVPRSGVLIALSKALGVSIPYLLNAQGLELGCVEFRTKSTTTGKDRARVETEVVEWVERYLQIETILGLESHSWSQPFKAQKIRKVDEAEGLADRVRMEWKLGTDPIPNMTELLEEKGLKVLTAMLPDKVSGLTCEVKGANHPEEIPVIVVNRTFPLERRRLTLAHELAHRVIDSSALDPKTSEKAAQRFAGAFLISKEHLQAKVGSSRRSFGYQELIDLKRLYRVSGASLLVRLRDVGVISDSTLTYAFQSVARTWRTQEPEPLEKMNENQGRWEPAKRFERLCYRALAESLISLPKAAELLRCPLDKVMSGWKGPNLEHAHSRK